MVDKLKAQIIDTWRSWDQSRWSAKLGVQLENVQLSYMAGCITAKCTTVLHGSTGLIGRFKPQLGRNIWRDNMKLFWIWK